MKKNLKTNAALILSAFVLSMLFMAFTPQKPWVIPDKYKTMKNPTKPGTGLDVGKTLYNTHCKACHGVKGYGDGPKALNLTAKIRSFASAEYKAQAPGAKYYESFIGRGEMPNFTAKITDETERWYLINFIETLK